MQLKQVGAVQLIGAAAEGAAAGGAGRGGGGGGGGGRGAGAHGAAAAADPKRAYRKKEKKDIHNRANRAAKKRGFGSFGRGGGQPN